MVNQYNGRALQYLKRMMDLTLKTEKYISGISYEEFENNSEKVDACITTISQIGELAGQLKKLEYEEFDIKIPYKGMIGMRNFLIHNYHKVDIQELRTVAKNDLPILKTELEKIL